MRVRQEDRGRFGGIAALLALVGMFAMSTGVALLVAASPANASSSVATPRGGECDEDWNKVAAKKDWCGDDCDDEVLYKSDGKKGGWCGDDCQYPEMKAGGKKGDWCGDDCDDDVLYKAGGRKGDWCGDDCDVIYLDRSAGKKGDWCGDGCDDEEMLVAGKKHDWCDEDEDTCDGEPGPVTKSSGERPRPLCLVTPGAPTFTDPTCDTDPGVTLPESNPVEVVYPAPNDKVAAVIGAEDVDGVHYEISGDLVPGGTVTVTASALPGYVLLEESPTSWEHTFSTPEECETVVEPPAEQEAVASPEVVVPTLVSAGIPAASTGNRTAAQGLVGAGLALMVGAGALSLVRRRSVTA